MSYITINIDGETVMDGDTGKWQQQPPEFIAKQLKAMQDGSTKPSPWMRALMLVVAEAAMTDTYTSVDVTTDGNAGWTLQTRYAIELKEAPA
jgi:cytochrome c553